MGKDHTIWALLFGVVEYKKGEVSIKVE